MQITNFLTNKNKNQKIFQNFAFLNNLNKLKKNPLFDPYIKAEYNLNLSSLKIHKSHPFSFL